MKRFLKQAVPTLHIYIDFIDVNEAVVASADFIEMQHPNIKRKCKKSDEWLKKVNDLARSIIGSMQGMKFNVIKAWPSKKSYTYYIRFQPADKNGDLWEQVFEFQIELRDHVSKTHPDIGEVNNKLFVRAYYIEDDEYRNMYEVVRSIFKILDSMQEGDFSDFFG